jgi:hypothetical protein
MNENLQETMEFYKVDTHQIWGVSCLLFLNQANDFFCHPVSDSLDDWWLE